MKLLVVMDPHKGEQYKNMDPLIQNQMGVQLPGASQDSRRIYVLEVEAAFEISEVSP